MLTKGSTIFKSINRWRNKKEKETTAPKSTAKTQHVYKNDSR